MNTPPGATATPSGADSPATNVSGETTIVPPGADPPAAGAPREAVTELAGCERPHLIGVRHHSPALAVAMPSLLAAARPEVLAIELPAEASEWLGWLTHPEATAPLAMAFTRGEGLSFYPFADFSPELVALRWARDHGVPVVCIDLPVGAEEASPDEPDPQPGGPAPGPGDPAGSGAEPWWRDALAARARAAAEDTNETWDRLVEAPAAGCTAEQVRVAALAHGWASRRAQGRIDPHTAAREACMRARVGAEVAAGRRVTAVVGAFHAPALLGLIPEQEPGPAAAGRAQVTGCVVGYSFAQLDSRSGYPAGIRDPGWQQAVVESSLDPAAIASHAGAIITGIVREVRRTGHPAGPGEAAEALRVALDLAAIRGLAAPSRRELVEAVTTVLAQGEVLGRGRAVAAAMQRVLIGDRRGKVAPGTPVSALRANLVGALSELGLPTSPSPEPRHLSLAPLRGGRDLAIHVLANRLLTGGVAYATPDEARAWRGAETVTTGWRLDWSAATEASIELVSVRGLTAEQLASTVLMSREANEPGEVLRLLIDAADCACPKPLSRAFGLLTGIAATAGFASAVGLSCALADIALGRVPGAALLPDADRETAGRLRAELNGAAVRELSGIRGSDEPADAAALAAFAGQAEEHRLSLAHALTGLLRDGSPLMQGAALGLLLGSADAGARLASWLDAPSPQARHALRRRLVGLLTTAASRFDTAEATVALVDRVNRLSDEAFVAVLPALRGGFDVLTAEARQELLRDLAQSLGPVRELALSPADTVAAARYDSAARGRLAALGLADIAFSPAERWRLILAEERSALSGRGQRMASALDELYGRPSSDALDRSRRSAGSGPSQLGVREWADEIEALFGAGEVQEIFAQAAEQGRGDVLDRLDPGAVRPSVELLTTALSLTGALSEARLGRLRPLVARMVRELTEQLAIRLRPALTGLSSARPTRRRTGELDLARTLRANLHHLVAVDGRTQVVPVHPVFRQPVAKESDWHLIIVVDVSGSMSESVVFSALTAAILAGVACLEVTFLAFSTEVIDFSGRVPDPLSLLLEVEVGGGTDIAGAMRVARSRVSVPGRTLCVLVSDFDEPGPVSPLLAEVLALHASGVRLLGCAALNDSGQAVYNVGVAQQVAGAGMRVAAVSPLDLARWVRTVVQG